MQTTNQHLGTPRAGRLLQWLYVYNQDFHNGKKWPRWAILDFITPPNERSEKRTYVFFGFLVSNGMAPLDAVEFMSIIDANPLDTPIKVKHLKREYNLKRLVQRAEDGSLFETLPKMKDMNMGYVPK